MMEAVRTSETSVDNHFTRQYIPEDNSEHHTRHRENMKSQFLTCWLMLWSFFNKSHYVTQWLIKIAQPVVGSLLSSLICYWTKLIECFPQSRRAWNGNWVLLRVSAGSETAISWLLWKHRRYKLDHSVGKMVHNTVKRQDLQTRHRLVASTPIETNDRTAIYIKKTEPSNWVKWRDTTASKLVVTFTN
jgi:hypothetical protein